MPTAVQAVTSAWTPPPTITGFSSTVYEEDSAIQLNWDLSSVTPSDFTGYRIYRRELGAAEYEVLVDITLQTIQQYLDETAGQSVIYEYIITQFKSVVGDVPIESEPSDTVTTSLTSDTWFAIMVIGTSYVAMELNVTNEEHSSVVQQEVFEPLSSGRKRVVRGNVLGDEGSITARFDTSVARVTKQRMETLKANKGPHILKSPFGDVWYVEFDSPGFKYLPGGHLEVTMGWVEVN